MRIRMSAWRTLTNGRNAIMRCPYCGLDHPQDAKFCPKTGRPLSVQSDPASASTPVSRPIPASNPIPTPGPEPSPAPAPSPTELDGRIKVASIVLLALSLLPLTAQFSVIGVGEVSVLDIWNVMLSLGNYAKSMGSSLENAISGVMFFLSIYLVMWICLLVRSGRIFYSAFQSRVPEGVLGTYVLSICLALVPIVGSMIVNGMVSTAVNDGISYLTGGYGYMGNLTVCSATGTVWIELLVSCVAFLYIKSSNLFATQENLDRG